ncbi:hypothetical protein Q1Z72_19635 [Pseudomonas qingdaonensis]|uniref:hypothetical protein n=1 Tax=Pseudomonas qingdaonensis TaxID=2056231 RepID=UPI00265F05B4|nr:hypothetical protein [Pseudomonas qingdaonensis]WKL65501.1 hypothetical protein Q1Z72_19635 [Pseudomonas qingdaonensis]
MSNHTPGPWVRCTEAPKIIMSGYFIDGHQGYIVGSVSGNDNSGFYASEEEAEANASLIAAAPELLEALELVIKEHAPSYHDCLDDGEPECAWCVASKAIAKARVKP